MFKSLIASALLSGAISMPINSPNTDFNRVAQNVSYNQFYGSYVIRQSDNYTASGLFDYEGAYSYNYENDRYVIYGYSHDYKRFAQISTLYIECEGGAFNINVRFSIDEESTYVGSIDSYSEDSTEDLDLNLSELVLYFADYTFIDNGFELINTWFSHDSNYATHYYTGWYTFSNNLSSANIYTLMGNITANNTMYNTMYYWTYNSGITFEYDSVTNRLPNYTLYGNNEWNGKRSIYFTNTLIPQDIYTYMLGTGAFDYIPDVNQSTFNDLFFSIADTPIYFVTQMFNFDLLGFNFGVALLSIATLLLLVIILKKVI